MIPASSRILRNRCCRDYRLAPITRAFIWRIRCKQCERWCVSHGSRRRQCPNQSEADWILLEAIWQKDGAAILWYIQQVEESIGGRVSGEKASVHYPKADPFQTALKWTSILWNPRWRLDGHLRELAAIGKFWQWCVVSVTVDRNVREDMCMHGSGGDDEGKARHHATSDRFARAPMPQGKRYPPRVAKYNFQGCDTLGAKVWQWPDIWQATVSRIHRYRALGAVV